MLKDESLFESGGHSSLTVDVLRGGVEVIDSIEHEWLKLCDEGPSNQWFQRPEFSRAYMRHFAVGREVVLFIVRDGGGRLVAVLPLYREKKWAIPGFFAVWKLKGPSMVDGYPFDLIVASKEKTECVATALWSAIDKFKGWNILEIPNVVEGGNAEMLTQAAALSRAAVYPWSYMHTPHISLRDWDGKNPLMLARSRNLRHTLKRILNTEGKNGIRLRRIESASEAFEQFFALENRSWKGKVKRTVAGSEKLRNFYMEIAKAAEQYGYLSFYFLEIGGVTVASRFALTYRGQYGELECIHDQKYKEHAPGHLIIAEILSDCARRGCREVNLSGHTYEYKERWTREFRKHTYWFIYRRGILGRLLYLTKDLIMPVIQRKTSTVKEQPNNHEHR